MFFYDNASPEPNPYTASPFVAVSQISFLLRSLPWQQYPHFHKDEFELCFVIRGQLTLLLPGTEVALYPGSISIVPPNVAHHYNGGPAVSSFYLRFRSMDNGSPVLESLRSLEACVTSTGSFLEMMGLIQVILGLCQKQKGLDGRTQTLCLAMLEMAEGAFRARGKTVSCSAPFYANDVLLYLQEHIHEKVTLEELSEHFHLSSSHLTRVFTRAYHISPIKYLIYARMRQARTYILSENMPASEIARRLAFNNTSHYINTFVDFFGCRPEVYREYEKQNYPDDLNFNFLIPEQTDS